MVFESEHVEYANLQITFLILSVRKGCINFLEDRVKEFGVDCLDCFISYCNCLRDIILELNGYLPRILDKSCDETIIKDLGVEL